MTRVRILLVFSLIYAKAVWPFAVNECADLTGILTQKVQHERAASKLIAKVPENLKALLESTTEKVVEQLEKHPETLTEPVHERTRKEAPRLERARFLECLKSTGVLVGVSTLVTIAGALFVNADQYGADESMAQLLEVETLETAGKDPEFRRQIYWNGLLMSIVGMAACYDSKWGKKGVTGAAAVASVGGQILAKGSVQIPQLVLDAAWVRFTSLYKTRMAYQATRSYKQSGLRGAAAMGIFFQTLSETIGAVGYPYAVRIMENLLDKF